MTRLLLSLLMVLSLLGASAPALAASPADCPMAAASPGMPMDHDEMGCCTSGCAIPCPAAVLPPVELDVATAPAERTLVTAAPADALRSVDPAAADPPPRALP